MRDEEAYISEALTLYGSHGRICGRREPASYPMD